MRDNLRRSRAIQDAVTQGYPGQRNGHGVRHVTTLAARISGIVGSKRTQLPHSATKVSDGSTPESRVTRVARWLDNVRILEEMYFLPYAERLLTHVAFETLVVVMDGRVVLRGGGGKPNYDSVTVALCEKALATKKVSTNLVIDCSHDNSNKDPGLQPLVMNDGVHQILEGNQSLVGFMLESNIHWGKQPIPADVSQLQYGVSVTDGCIDWATTDKVLREARDKLKDVLSTRL